MSESTGSSDWSYDERDVCLYALSIGCKASESRYVYESDENFAVLPTFAVLPLHRAMNVLDASKLVPNFSPMRVLHGEQYLELKEPLPVSAILTTHTSVFDIIDKGKGAIIILKLTTKIADKPEVIAENEATIFVRGSGGFGRAEPKQRKAEAVASHKIPLHPPDAVLEEQTGAEQAALYRLNGDLNPLHIDPEFARLGGFSQPILHGLCSFGFAAKHVLQAFADGDPKRFKSIKGRFASHVVPGETLRTEMWKVAANKIVFQVKVVERGVIVISSAAVVLHNEQPTSKI